MLKKHTHRRNFHSGKTGEHFYPKHKTFINCSQIPQARKEVKLGKFAKYFKRTRVQHLKGIHLFTPDVTDEMQPCKRRWRLSNCSNVSDF